VVSSLLVIFLPMLVQEPPPASLGVEGGLIPERPQGDFSSRVQPLPPMPMTPPQAQTPDLPFLDHAVQESTPADMQVNVLGDQAAAVPAQPDSAGQGGVSSRAADHGGAAEGTRVGLQAWIYQVGSFSNPMNAQKLVD